MIDEVSLRSGLRTDAFGGKIYSFDVVDSTNTRLRAAAERGDPEGTVAIAEEQSLGRGRMGRSWISERGENLMFSLLLRPTLPAEKVHLFPFLAAVALADGIQRATSLQPECKWPNDLLLRSRKVAGILLESAVQGRTIEYVILGMGINVNQRHFPEELRDRATSILLEQGAPADRVRLFQVLLESLEHYYERVLEEGPDPVLQDWVRRSPMINQRVSVVREDETLTGVMRGVTREGGMILSVDGTDRIVHAGDATVVRN